MNRPPAKYPIDETVMRRLDALELLIDNEYDSSPKVFQDRTGIKMAQVGQWFSGYRALRDKALRRLESKTKKAKDWFDGATAKAAITLPAITIAASGSQSQPSHFAKGICEAFDKLPDDFELRHKVSGECLEAIRKAKDPPTLKEGVPDLPRNPKAA